MKKFTITLIIIITTMLFNHGLAGNNPAITIVKISPPIEYLVFSKNPPTIQEVSEQYDYKYIINASYFESDLQHAGWLKIKGKLYSEIKSDKQLTHIVVIKDKMQVFSVKDFKPSDDNTSIEFQTGPLVIQHNQIMLENINQTINGKRNNKRTLLGFTEDGFYYFIITRNRIKLFDLAEILLKEAVFQNKDLTVVNLDGGSSTALYYGEGSSINYRVYKKLPYLLVVKN